MAEAQPPTVENSEAVGILTTEVNSEVVELKAVGVMLTTEVSTVAVAEEKLEWKEMNALVKEAA